MGVLTLILLNNLISHTQFWLSANQITSYNVFIQLNKLKHSVDPDQMTLQKPSDLGLYYLQR